MEKYIVIYTSNLQPSHVYIANFLSDSNVYVLYVVISAPNISAVPSFNYILIWLYHKY